MATDLTTSDATGRLARYVLGTKLKDMPTEVRVEARRAFLNILGCMLGGARHATVDAVDAAFGPFAGPPKATLIGRSGKTDPLHATLINCVASSVHSFDDTHALAIVHPSGPVAAAALAVAEQQPISGANFLAAFALGIETVCRVSMALSVAPARGTIAWSQTGIAGGLGAAVAAAKLMALDEDGMRRAIGIAASQAAGMRVMHGTMTTALMPAQAAQTGLQAALLAAQGLTASLIGLEGRYGYLSVFAEEPHLAYLLDDFGERFEVLRNTYKPYPCGIVIHPILDACLRLKRDHTLDYREIERVAIKASPSAMALSDRRNAVDEFQTHVSLYHWVAVAFIRGTARTTDMLTAVALDPVIVGFQDRITAVREDALTPDAAEVMVTLRDGQKLTCRIEHCIGSESQPMTDEQLEDKFLDLAETSIGVERGRKLIAACRAIETASDVGAIARDAG
jgi:2-methylcitrate dehydratase PrpD